MKRLQYHMIGNRGLLRTTLAEAASQAENAGVHYFQLREKDLSPGDLFALASEIRPLLRKTFLIVNGSLEVTLASKANGIHLQRGNLPVSVVRSRYKELLIGYSAHSLEEMKEAEKQGASYVFISPVFQPLSKSTVQAPLGISVVASWNKQMGIPVYALGGISIQNLPEVSLSGCAGVAGISLFLEDGYFTSKGMAA